MRSENVEVALANNRDAFIVSSFRSDLQGFGRIECALTAHVIRTEKRSGTRTYTVLPNLRLPAVGRLSVGRITPMLPIQDFMAEVEALRYDGPTDVEAFSGIWPWQVERADYFGGPATKLHFRGPPEDRVAALQNLAAGPGLTCPSSGKLLLGLSGVATLNRVTEFFPLVEIAQQMRRHGHYLHLDERIHKAERHTHRQMKMPRML